MHKENGHTQYDEPTPAQKARMLEVAQLNALLAGIHSPLRADASDEQLAQYREFALDRRAEIEAQKEASLEAAGAGKEGPTVDAVQRLVPGWKAKLRMMLPNFGGLTPGVVKSREKLEAAKAELEAAEAEAERHLQLQQGLESMRARQAELIAKVERARERIAEVKATVEALGQRISELLLKDFDPGFGSDIVGSLFVHYTNMEMGKKLLADAPMHEKAWAAALASTEAEIKAFIKANNLS